VIFSQLTLNRWIPEVTHHCPNIPIVLAATKIDLREDPTTLSNLEKKSLKPVQPSEGEAFAKKIKCYAYQECSSRLNKGVNEVFESCMRAVLFPNDGFGGHGSESKKKNCLLL